MTATISIEERKTVVANDQRLPERISWEAFKADYLEREDGFKYEWVNGVVEKTQGTMDRTQFFIVQNLLDFFGFLKFSGKISGSLMPEGDTFLAQITAVPMSPITPTTKLRRQQMMHKPSRNLL